MPTASVNENRMKKNEWPEELPPSLFSFLPNFFFSLVSFFFFFFFSIGQSQTCGGGVDTVVR